MTVKQSSDIQNVNLQRRSLLQGAVCVGAASFAPAVFSKALSVQISPELSGKLICNISNPVKTLVLHNHSNQTMVIEHVLEGALMFDGSIVDCNTACLTNSITIPANQEVQVQFDRREQSTLLTKVHEYRRFQSRVTRLSDGTRVIPFTATVNGNVVTVI